jgi:hypothetical protein
MNIQRQQSDFFQSQRAVKSMASKELLSRKRPRSTARLVHRVALSACLAGMLLLVEGCGGGSTSSQVQTAPPQLTSITVSPSTVSVVLGSNQQFTATGNYTDGSTKDLTQNVSWASSAATVATVSSSGLATALMSGEASISATMSGLNGAANLKVTSPSKVVGSLGSASASPVTCPSGGLTGTCYSVVLSCPNINDLTGYLKVTFPTGTPVGTIIFTTGANGTTLYEAFKHGPDAMNTLLQNGYTVAQISWGEPFTAGQIDGWQTYTAQAGSTSPGGIYAVGCRYATLAQWIYNNIHLANKSAPFCATGNSGGAQLIGLAMARYGMGSIFAMVEPTSGPPFARQDWACDWQEPPTTGPCGNPDLGFGLPQSDAANFVDPAYAKPVSCLFEVDNQKNKAEATLYDPIFLNDSVASPDAELNYPNTFVNFLYGGTDTSTAPNQGHLWEAAITSSKAESCVADAGHSMPDSEDAAQQIASDLLKYCILPAGP